MRRKCVSCMWQGMSLVKMRMHKSCLILRCKQLLTKTPVRFNTFRILPACRSRCERPVFYPHSCPPELSEHGLCMVFNARKIAVSAFSALPEKLFGDVIMPLLSCEEPVRHDRTGSFARLFQPRCGSFLCFPLIVSVLCDRFEKCFFRAAMHP